MKKLLICFFMLLIGAFSVNALQILLTESPYKGGFGGPIAADIICQTQFSPNFKALVGIKGERDLNHDWPLVAGQAYYNVLGQFIGIVPQNKCLSSLSNPVDLDEVQVWAGIDNNCQTFEPGQDNCYGWLASSSAYGKAGLASVNSFAWLDYSSDGCSNEKYIYCVEQGHKDEGKPVPEFSNLTFIAILLVVIIVFVKIKNK